MVDAAIIVIVLVVSIALSAFFAFRRRTKAESESGFDWTLTLRVVVGTTVVFLSLIVYSAYGGFLYLLVSVPIFLACLLILVDDAIRKRTRQSVSMLLTLVVLSGTSWFLLRNESTLRPSLRWALWSHRFKAEVLAQPAPANGELRHMEWEATGFAGVANNTVYLVFDPKDSLAAAAKSHSPGRFSGIPCEVPRVLRLESHWYCVAFYTDEEWGQRNALNCE